MQNEFKICPYCGSKIIGSIDYGIKEYDKKEFHSISYPYSQTTTTTSYYKVGCCKKCYTKKNIISKIGIVTCGSILSSFLGGVLLCYAMASYYFFPKYQLAPIMQGICWIFIYVGLAVAFISAFIEKKLWNLNKISYERAVLTDMLLSDNDVKETNIKIAESIIH